MFRDKTVAVIGGGPAGMSCALWLKHFNFNPVLIERDHVLGGLQRLNSGRNKWLLGHSSITGHEMSETFQRNLKLEDIPIFVDTKVTRVEKSPKGFQLRLGGATSQSISTGSVLEAVAVVIATGTTLKKEEAFANVPGIDTVIQRKLIRFTPPSIDALVGFSGKRVAVIGGGDNAFETALSIVRIASHVDLMIRSRVRAQGWLQEKMHQCVAAGEVTVHAPANIQRFQLLNDTLQLTLLEASGKVKQLDVHHVIARTGFTPSNVLLDTVFSDLERDERGYLRINTDTMQTSMDGVYAIGDICNAVHPCVATAIAHGTMAARSIERRYRSEPMAYTKSVNYAAVSHDKSTEKILRNDVKKAA
jgi:thioredoxin reductase (NADPH)